MDFRPIDTLIPSRREIIANHQCVFCGGPAVVFDSILSHKEYNISGMCQTCQDGFFA